GDRRAGTGEATLIFCHKLTQCATGRVAGKPNAASEIYSTFSGYAADLCSVDLADFQAPGGRLIVLLVCGPLGGCSIRRVARGDEPTLRLATGWLCNGRPRIVKARFDQAGAELEEIEVGRHLPIGFIVLTQEVYQTGTNAVDPVVTACRFSVGGQLK